MSKRGLVIGIVSISTVLFFASFFTSLYRGSAPRAKAEQENVNITMNPNVGTIGSDPQTITLIIQPTTAGNIISGVDLALAASGQLLIMDVAAPVGFPDDNQNVFTEVYKDVSGTNAHISYISTLADEQLPPAVKVEVTVAGNGAGNGALAVETSSTQIVGKIVGYVYGYNTVDNAQFTFTGDSNQYYLQNSSGKNLTVKIRLQGVLERPRYPATVPVKVTLIDTSGEQHVYTIPVQPETGGVWSGNAPIDAPEGDGYTALVKGAMHVQKKVTMPVTINAGETVIDLSLDTLFAGDITGADNAQDGVIDAADIEFIRDHLGETAEGILQTADLNFDGIVDTQDYSLVLSALGHKIDEQ